MQGGGSRAEDVIRECQLWILRRSRLAVALWAEEEVRLGMCKAFLERSPESAETFGLSSQRQNP